MFLDGMPDQLSRLRDKNNASESNHPKSYPLDGIKKSFVWVWLAKESEKKLRGPGGRKG
jgi:hypothetical protein